MSNENNYFELPYTHEELVTLLDKMNDLEVSEGIQGPQGPQGEQGPKGEDGYTPVKGVDYFTEEELSKLRYDDAELKEKIKELEELHEDKYVIKGAPEGTLVDYREKEIRVMVPADAEFVQQEVGEGGNPNMYYMSLTSKAPVGAVKLIESDGNKTEEIDLEGKVSKTIWLALASKSGDAWSYFGKGSSPNKFIGWTYTLKWLDENDMVIESDCFRINLSNESCHNDLMPYLGAPLASKAYVEEQIAELRAMIEELKNN